MECKHWHRRYLFVNGQPVDGLGGPQELQAIRALCWPIICPAKMNSIIKQALELIQTNQHGQALALLQALPDDLKQKGDVKLAIDAECLLETQDFEQAKALLGNIPLEYQDNYYKGLVAKLELHEQSANSPEIQSLEKQFQAESSNVKLAAELALSYHQVNRDQEALEILWQFVSRDLNALDGEIKKHFMDILAALGQTNSVSIPV